MKDAVPFKLNNEFLRRASGHSSGSSQAESPSMSIRRPPVPERKTADFRQAHMAGYIEGLERRMVRHLERHAPAWHRKETVETLNDWNAKALNHPAPQGTAPRHLVREASEYAAHKVEMRIAKRFHKIDAAKMRVGLYDDSVQGIMNRSQRRADLRDKMRLS